MLLRPNRAMRQDVFFFFLVRFGGVGGCIFFAHALGAVYSTQNLLHSIFSTSAPATHGTRGKDKTEKEKKRTNERKKNNKRKGRLRGGSHIVSSPKERL